MNGQTDGHWAPSRGGYRAGAPSVQNRIAWHPGHCDARVRRKVGTRPSRHSARAGEANMCSLSEPYSHLQEDVSPAPSTLPGWSPWAPWSPLAQLVPQGHVSRLGNVLSTCQGVNVLVCV